MDKILKSRFSWVLGGVAAAALLAPLSAQAQYRTADQFYGDRSYRGACEQVRGERQAAGAIIGGLLGAAIGNGVAADNTQAEGTALGAVLGSAIGAGIAGDQADCVEGRYDPYGRRTQHEDWRRVNNGYGYGDRDLRGGPVDYGRDYGRGYGGGNDDWRYRGQSGQQPYRIYDERDDIAARECETVWRTIHLPDGRQIREPVRACREATYGDWQLAN